MYVAQFIEKELDYISVNRYVNAYLAAIQWVYDGRTNIKDIITYKFSLDNIEEDFKFVGKNLDKLLKLLYSTTN